MATRSSTPIEKTRATFWVLLVVALVSVAGYVYLFRQLKAVNAANVSLTQDSNAILAEQSQIGVIKQSLSDTDARRAKLDSYFVDPNNVVPFLETIEGYGKTAGVSTTFSEVQLADKPTHLTVTVDANGSFTNIYRFVSMLEAAPYEIQVTESDIQTVVPGTLNPIDGLPKVAGWDAAITLSVLSVSGATQ